MAENSITGSDGAVYINIDEGLKRVVNNGKLFAKLLNKFKTENAHFLEEALDYAGAGDFEKAKVSIHTLKGITGNLALTELYKQTLETESQIKAGAVKEETRESVKKCLAETCMLIDGVIAKYGG
jgi:HPt (histidine-containing phosphotransfer) domain-containing protein